MEAKFTTMTLTDMFEWPAWQRKLYLTGGLVSDAENLRQIGRAEIGNNGFC